MRKWMIFYDDGSSYSNEDGEWADAPTDGVLFVLCKRGDVIQTIGGGDHYMLLDDETVIETQDLGPLLRKWGVKFGRWTTHRNLERISKIVADEAAKWPR